MQIANRESFAVASRRRLPYDAEVEYLQSSGSQYIDTGVIAADNVGVQMNVVGGIVPSSPNPSTTMLFGVFGSDNRYGLGYNVRFFVWWNAASGGENFSDAYSGTFSLNYNNSRTFACGMYYSGSLSETYNASNTQIRLLNALRMDTGQNAFADCASCRFGAVRITQGTTLVRDLIPVRKGDAGYLYDRITGQLLGNAGTGDDFVIGPDRTSWTNPYVTEGLIAMWDGEWNAGPGAHNADATTWADLSGNGCNLNAPAQYSIGSYFCDLPKGNRFTGALPSVLSAVTVEFVGGFTASYASSTDCDLGVETGGRGLGSVFLSNISNLTRDVMIATRSSNASSQTTYKIQGPYPSNATTAYVNTLNAFSGTAKISSGKDFSLYVNGVARNGSSSIYYNAGATTPSAWIGVGSTGKTAIRLCCVRVYSRVLTAAEIAANHAIDRERFGTP